MEFSVFGANQRRASRARIERSGLTISKPQTGQQVSWQPFCSGQDEQAR
jgi:hypothetical protein